MKALILSLLLIFLPATVLAKLYDGFSDYRLVRFEHQTAQFNPEVDILKPTAAEAASEEAMEQFLAASIKSLIPVMNSFSAAGNLFDSLMASAEVFRQELSKSLSSVKGEGPYVEDIFLIPWTKNRKDIFYSEEKVSIDNTGIVDTLRQGSQSQEFEQELSKNIRALQKKNFKQGQAPIFLLGSQAHVYVEPKKQSFLRLSVLVGLNPLSKALPEPVTNDKVRLDTVKIPSYDGLLSAEESIVSVLTLFLPLSPGQGDPRLKVEFGRLDAFKDGSFAIKSAGRRKATPCITGNANKGGLKWVATHFCFTELTFSLLEQKLTALDLLVRPGIRLGKASFVVGGLHINSVDEEFQNEFNKMIDTQLESARKKGEELAVVQGLSVGTLKAGVSQVFGVGAAQ